MILVAPPELAELKEFVREWTRINAKKKEKKIPQSKTFALCSFLSAL
jgi:hypothetical protein